MKVPSKEEIQAKLNAYSHPEVEILEITHPGLPAFNSFADEWAFELPPHTHLKMVKPGLVLQGESEDGGHPLLRSFNGVVEPLGKFQASAAGHRSAWADTGKGADLAVDHKLVPLLEKLWRHNLPTVFSCQGGPSYRTQYASLVPGVRFRFRDEIYESAYPFVKTDAPAYLCFNSKDTRAQALEYLVQKQGGVKDKFKLSETIWGGASLHWMPSDFPAPSLLSLTRHTDLARPAKFSCTT